MDASVTSAVIAGIGVILTAWLGFAGNKKGTLAVAEQEFRKTIITENERLRERVDELELKLSTVMVENRHLKLEMIELKKFEERVNSTEGVSNGTA